MNVLKFGGSSVANGERMLNIIELLKQRQDEKTIVVLSACQSVTNQLEKAAKYVQNRNLNAANIVIDEIKNLHLQIVNQYIHNKQLLKQIHSIIETLCSEVAELLQGVSFLNELTPMVMARIYSFGELLSSQVFYTLAYEAGLNVAWFDIRNFLITDSTFLNAYPLEEKIEENKNIILEYFHKNNLIITQGFIASDLLGRTTVLGRGGSDFSAALIGATLESKNIEIWSDVNGILSADPRIVPEAISIPQMQYSEVKDLSFWGAKVLHHKTILPAINKNIPVKMLNSLNPENIGTTIINDTTKTKSAVHSIVTKSNCTLLTIEQINNTENRFYDLIKNILNQNLNYLYASYSQSKLQLIVYGNFNELRHHLQNYEFTIKTDLNAICIVGNNFNQDNNFFGNIVSNVINAQVENNLSWQYFGQYSSKTLLFLTDYEDINNLVSSIHNTLIKKSNL